MPHVTGHFCVCHVELWLLFHDFFPVPGYLFLDLDLGIWVPGYLGTCVPGYLGTWAPGCACRTPGSGSRTQGSDCESDSRTPESDCRTQGVRLSDPLGLRQKGPTFPGQTAPCVQFLHRKKKSTFFDQKISLFKKVLFRTVSSSFISFFFAYRL